MSGAVSAGRNSLRRANRHALQPFIRYWDDDTLEVFIDEVASGGEHTYSHNAFGYHIALVGNAVDLGDAEHDCKRPIVLNDHVTSA